MALVACALRLTVVSLAATLLVGCGGGSDDPVRNLYVIDQTGGTSAAVAEAGVEPYVDAFAKVRAGCTNTDNEIANMSVATVDMLAERTGRTWTNLYVLLVVAKGVGTNPSDCSTAFAFAGMLIESQTP